MSWPHGSEAAIRVLTPQFAAPTSQSRRFNGGGLFEVQPADGELAELDAGEQLFAVLLVMHADDVDAAHDRKRVQDPLDLAGQEVLPFADDSYVRAAINILQ